MSIREITPPPPNPSTQVSAISGWPGKHVEDLQSPLSNAWSYRGGFIGIAGRISLLVLFVVIPLGLIAYHLRKRRPPVSEPFKPDLGTPRTQRHDSIGTSTTPQLSPTPNRFGIGSTSFATAKSCSLQKSAKKRRASLPPYSPYKPPRGSLNQERIKEAVIEIDLMYKELVTDLGRFPAETEAFEQLCLDFDDKYNRFAEDPLFLQCMAKVNNRWNRFGYLKFNYENIWTQLIAGRDEYLFQALFTGMQEYLYAFSMKEPCNTHQALRDWLILEMKKKIETDQELQRWTDLAVEAASIAFEAANECAIDDLLETVKTDDYGSYEPFVQPLQSIQKTNTLKADIATANYPAYFEEMEKGLRKFGSINAIYVFSQLFPEIKITVPKRDGSEYFCFNPEGTFTLALGIGDQNQFVYVAK